MAKIRWTKKRVMRTDWKVGVTGLDHGNGFPYKVFDPISEKVVAHTVTQQRANELIRELRCNGFIEADE